MINRYEKAMGLRLFKLGRFQMEIWYVPAGYAVPEHYHTDFDSRFLLLFAHNILFRRNGRTLLVKWWKHIGKLFAINAGDIHSSDASNFPLIFVNIEIWKHKPTSACKNFIKT